MSFNVVINSADKVAGSSVTNAVYYFDWNNFRDVNCSYEMSFVFTSDSVVATTTKKVLSLSLPDLPQLNYRANGTKIGANTSGIVGVLFPSSVSTTKEVYNAKVSDNAPVYVKSLPTNAEFKVDLVSDGVNTPASYTLIISFEKIEQ